MKSWKIVKRLQNLISLLAFVFFEVGIIDKRLKSAQMWELSINIEDLTLNSLHTGVSSGGQGCCPRLETPVSYEENLR